MIGTKVERQGSSGTARRDHGGERGDGPEDLLLLRKAYARAVRVRRRFEPDATIACRSDDRGDGRSRSERRLFNKIQEKPESERAAYVQQLRDDTRRTSTSTSSRPSRW